MSLNMVIAVRFLLLLTFVQGAKSTTKPSAATAAYHWRALAEFHRSSRILLSMMVDKVGLYKFCGNESGLTLPRLIHWHMLRF